jgi:hypothetical protein
MTVTPPNVDLSIQQPQTVPDGAPRVSAICGVDLSHASTFSAGAPHQAFDALRSAAPVAWQDEEESGRRSAELHTGMPQPPSPGFWVVTNHELVTEVSKDPTTYSSYLGGTQMFSADEMLLAGLRLMLLYMDPPDQTRLRKLLVPSFTPRVIDQMTEAITNSARDLCDAIEGAGAVDLVETVTKQLPTRTIAALLGMPEEDWHLIPEWSDSLIGSESEDLTDEDLLASAMTFQAVHDYGAKIFEEKRANPTGDLVSSLATAEIDGEKLTVEEFCMFWLLLIVAGNETTRNSLSGGVLALHQHGLWSELAARVAGGAPIDQTITDELVRFVSPVMHFRRTATRDVTLGDQHIRSGDKVVMWYGAANRDPKVFDNPHVLDLARDPNPHLGFGIGPHFCLGTRLARLQISIMLTELLTRFPDMTLDGEPKQVLSTFINGIERLPVKLG